uniref:Uncharacterized protein n=1 Tax=Anguilla anguilla TaxID=7936 RepID=A0A0E9TSI0_ANGAN
MQADMLLSQVFKKRIHPPPDIKQTFIDAFTLDKGGL